MATYRQRPQPPVIVEAEQWFPSVTVKGVEGKRFGSLVIGLIAPHNMVSDGTTFGHWVLPEWWVLRHADGRIWQVLSPAAFATEWEPITS